VATHRLHDRSASFERLTQIMPQNAVPAVRQRGRDALEQRAGGTAVSRAMNCTVCASAARWPTVRRRECGTPRRHRWRGSRGTATGAPSLWSDARSTNCRAARRRLEPRLPVGVDRAAAHGRSCSPFGGKPPRKGLPPSRGCEARSRLLPTLEEHARMVEWNGGPFDPYENGARRIQMVRSMLRTGCQTPERDGGAYGSAHEAQLRPRTASLPGRSKRHRSRDPETCATACGRSRSCPHAAP
jgi:hypothetical protein